MLRSTIVFSFLILSTTAQAADLGFRYNASAFRCLNENQEAGYNPSYPGECGEYIGAELPNTYWESFKLSGSNFSRANLEEASFYGADLRGVEFKWAKLKLVNFEYAWLVRADLRRAKASKAIFYWTNMQNTKQQGADLSYADLRGATLDLALVDRKTKFTGAVFDEFTTLPFSHLKAKSLGMKFIPSRAED